MSYIVKAYVFASIGTILSFSCLNLSAIHYNITPWVLSYLKKHNSLKADQINENTKLNLIGQKFGNKVKPKKTSKLKDIAPDTAVVPAITANVPVAQANPTKSEPTETNSKADEKSIDTDPQTASVPPAPPAPEAPAAPAALDNLVASEPSKSPIKVKTRDWGEKFDSVKKVFEQASNDREELARIRQANIDAYEQMRQEANPDYFKITNNITNDTVNYLQNRIAQTIQKLGPAPTEFSIFTMGSLAREESGFFTDLEIGILVKEKNVETYKYFKKFAQILADRFFLLGEHPDVGGKGLRMDEADNSPAHLKFFARYASDEQIKNLLHKAIEKKQYDKIPVEGSRLFIATPEEFAQHSNPKYLDAKDKQNKYQSRALEKKIFRTELNKALKNPINKGRALKELKSEIGKYVREMVRPYTIRERKISKSAENLSRNLRHLYGNKNIFDLYIEKRDKFLTGQPRIKSKNYATHRQEIAYLKIKEDILKHLSNSKSAISTGILSDEIDLKREIYRFPEQILTNLGFWHDLGEQNTVKIAHMLVAKGIISKEVCEKIVDLMNFSMGLRLKKQSTLKQQAYAIPTTAEKYNELKEELETELKQLTATKDLLVKTSSQQSDIEEIDNKIIKTQKELHDLEKLVPLEDDSILNPEDITIIKEKYIPILKKLFDLAKEFVSGNATAFLTTTI